MMKAGFVIDDDPNDKKDCNNDINKASESSSEGLINSKMRAGKTFSEDELNVKEEKELTINDLSADDFTTVDIDDDKLLNQKIHYSFWTSPVLWLLAIVGILSTVEVVNIAISIFEQNTVMGYTWSIVFFAILSFIILQIYKEISAVMLLVDAEKSREKIENIVNFGSCKQALSQCNEMVGKQIPKEFLEKFKNAVQPHFSAKEVFELYERMILCEQDKKAKNVIFKRSIETSLFIAMSPLAWLDMAFASFRAFKMIREISEIYGFRPGLWGRMKIYRKVITNMIYVGLADLLIDAATDFTANTSASVIDKLVGKLNSALAMGIAVGFYSTKIGFMTVRSVRPLDLTDNSKEIFNLSHLRLDLCKYVIKKLTFGREKKKI